MGVASGCGCKEVYRFPHIYYLSLLLLYLFFFTAASLLFVHLKKCFSFLYVIIIMYSVPSVDTAKCNFVCLLHFP